MPNFKGLKQEDIYIRDFQHKLYKSPTENLKQPILGISKRRILSEIDFISFLCCCKDNRELEMLELDRCELELGKTLLASDEALNNIFFFNKKKRLSCP